MRTPVPVLAPTARPRRATVRHVPTIIDFTTDPQLLGLSISPAQRTLLKSIYGLPLTPEEYDLWRLCTGRARYPAHPFSRVTCLCGARAGKDSRIAAPVMLYEALFGGHERYIAKGETGVLVIFAQDVAATQVAFDFIHNYLEQSPVLADKIVAVRLSPTREITLRNGLRIRCYPCTESAARGYAIVGGVMDELAYYKLEGSADSDVEIQLSITRGMGRGEPPVPKPKLIKISTPYMRGGVLFSDFTKAFGQDNDTLLVWRAPTLLMNPTQRAHVESERQELDPLRFQREYEAEFSDDVAAFLPGAVVESAVIPGRRELAPNVNCHYVAGVDATGGGDDAFGFAVVHVEGQRDARRIVQDVMRGWARRGGPERLNLEATIKEIAACCRTFHCSTVHGDRYAAGLLVEAFRREGIRYLVPEVKTADSPDAERVLSTSMAFLELEPLLLQGRIDLLDHPTMVRELTLLERRPQQQGRTLVSHPRGAHDDYATALAVAAAMAARSGVRPMGGPVVPGNITILGEPGGAVGEAIRPVSGGPGGQMDYVQQGRVGGQAGMLNRPYGRWG